MYQKADTFKNGDTIKITDIEVVDLNRTKLFKVVNEKPYEDNDLFVGIANEFESGIINKRCITKINA